MVTEAVPVDPQVRQRQIFEVFGAARYANNVRGMSTTHVVEFLLEAEREDWHVDLGHRTFVDLIESFMSKSSFYRAKELYLKEGAQNFKYLEEWKVSDRTRQLLSSGDIFVDGNEVVIGGEERVPLGESKVIKTVIEQLVRDKVTAETVLAKSEAVVAKKDAKNKDLSAENQRLNEVLDAMEEGTPFEQAYLRAIKALITLKNEIEELDHDERRERAGVDVPEFERRLEEIREAYGAAAWQM